MLLAFGQVRFLLALLLDIQNKNRRFKSTFFDCPFINFTKYHKWGPIVIVSPDAESFRLNQKTLALSNQADRIFLSA